MLCVAKLFASELIVENGKTLVLVEDSNEIGKLKEKSQIWIPHPQEKDKSILVLPISYYAKERKLHLANGKIVRIYKGTYKIEQIRMDSNNSKPNPKNQARNKQERDDANKIYANYTK